MKALWEALLKDALPTKWSRLIAGSIVPLTLSAYFLPEKLSKIGVSLSPQQTQGLQKTLPLIVLCLGVLVLLISVVYHYRNSRLTSEKFKNYKAIKTNKGSIFFVKIGEEQNEIYYCALCFHSQILSPLQPSKKIGFIECRKGCGDFPQINTEKLDLAYGAYWDKNFNMYCLSCKKYLKHSSLGKNKFLCSDPKCNSLHVLRDDGGLPITKQGVIRILKNKTA